MSRDTLVNPLPLLLFGDTFANPPLECHVWIASKTKRAQAHVQWLNQAPVSGVRHTSFSRSFEASCRNLGWNQWFIKNFCPNIWLGIVHKWRCLFHMLTLPVSHVMIHQNTVKLSFELTSLDHQYWFFLTTPSQ